MSMKELLESKHPTSWIEFEKGLISEEELTRKFFKDGRSFDMEGKRKPDPDFYLEVVKHLNVNASNCIFVDDRMGNVEAAIELGLKGLQFKNADLLQKDLSLLGVDISTNESQDLIECSS
uniref:HAD-superfamily hydrolase, subfamily IA, variant 3 n=1 Tax=Solanum tuberosum TaxID=4113 RepID=M1C5N3_SOLTU